MTLLKGLATITTVEMDSNVVDMTVVAIVAVADFVQIAKTYWVARKRPVVVVGFDPVTKSVLILCRASSLAN